MISLGVRIKELRENNHMSICELASNSGLSDSYLGRLESGQRRDPSISTVIKIADALNISVKDLLGEKDFYKIELSTAAILDSKIQVDGFMLNQKQKNQLFEFFINL